MVWYAWGIFQRLVSFLATFSRCFPDSPLRCLFSPRFPRYGREIRWLIKSRVISCYIKRYVTTCGNTMFLQSCGMWGEGEQQHHLICYTFNFPSWNSSWHWMMGCFFAQRIGKGMPIRSPSTTLLDPNLSWPRRGRGVVPKVVQEWKAQRQAAWQDWRIFLVKNSWLIDFIENSWYITNPQISPIYILIELLIYIVWQVDHFNGCYRAGAGKMGRSFWGDHVTIFVPGISLMFKSLINHPWLVIRNYQKSSYREMFHMM